MINRIKRYLEYKVRIFFHKPSLPEIKIKQEDINALSYKPLISVIVPVYNIESKYLIKCIESVKKQTYPNWELCLFDDCSTLSETISTLKKQEGKDSRIKISYSNENLNISNAMNQCAILATGEFLSFLDNDDELQENALYFVALALNKDPGIDYFYTDEDKIDTKGKHSEEYFKPDYSPELLTSVMYFLHLITIRKSLFQKLGGFRDEYAGAQDYDLALRVTRETKKIHHIPEILYHWRKIPGSAAAKVDAKPKALENAKKALEDHARIISNGNAYIEPGLLHGTFRLRYKILSEPEVTILIPTNNGRRTLAGRRDICLVDNLVESIKGKTNYKNYKIKVIDNGNSSDDTKNLFKRLDVDLINYQFDRTVDFNFAQKANFCFQQAKTEYVLFLNDDMEVREPNWLLSLLEPLQNKEVGVVGAKLIYPDESTQHMGIILNSRNLVAHVFHGLSKNAIGQYGYSHMIRNYSAITGACLITRKKILDEVGGFDLGLGIDFNDIDFCLRVRNLGYRIVYTPFCELFHFEQSTLQRFDQKKEEKDLFVSRWESIINADPYSNKNWKV